jgi:superfamily II RNA helicase
MDIETELGCVVFDEIHMINDADRGHVWENSIMLLPPHIQMVGLSATLDDPERFAYWLENRGEQNANASTTCNAKQVYLTKKKDRAVPLTHYSFITTTQGIFKAIKDKTVQEEIKTITNKPFIMQTAKGEFNEQHYCKMNKMLKLFETNNVRVKRAHALNQVSKYLCENDMLPALCYVFSRKQIEICAKELTTNLLEQDSKIPYIIKRECEQIIRKLPNFEEYFQLPEYITLVSLLEKGVATHHSGMMPVLREIVELLFAKGYIKFLFCTESVAIGLNLPVKTTIFTDVNKHDGNVFRMLQGHEFVQASGRAGRLGIDTVGHVFHLNNLFRNMDMSGYKHMMAGNPQTLTSKFKISYNLILNLIDIGDYNLIDFAKKSMVTGDLDAQMGDIYNNMNKLIAELDTMRMSLSHLRTPKSIIVEYIELHNNKNTFVNKKRKEVERRIQEIQDGYKYIENDKVSFKKITDKEEAICSLHTQVDTVNNYINSGIQSVIGLLLNEKYIEPDNTDTPVNKYKLTIKGSFATHLREVHCLVFAKVLEDSDLNALSAKQLVTLFSCFTNITVSDDLKDNVPKCKDKACHQVILKVGKLYADYQQKETNYNVNSGSDYNMQYDLINYVTHWCDCKTAEDCKVLLRKLIDEKGIFLGEFVKALLKINNISGEMEKLAELTGNVALLSKLREISNITLKYVVTNQSLYV